tara:strand:- start:7510 stop:7695 length:186 start_codon:yes stop_codon:yes gene_type:complete
MKYTVRVTEVYELEREYYVDADNKKQAKQIAKDSDWYDASDVDGQYHMRKIKINEVVKEVA